jgi:hypothetical protein
MNYLAHGGYTATGAGTTSDDMAAIIVAGLGFLAIGLLLGYVLGAGRVPGITPRKKSTKK